MKAPSLRLALATAAVLLLATPLVALTSPAPGAEAVLARPHVRLWTRLLPGFLLVGIALRRRQTFIAAR